jgi:dihydropteroate synthase
VRDLAVPVVLMHSQGDPEVMQVAPRYDDVALDVFDALAAGSPSARPPAWSGRA